MMKETVDIVKELISQLDIIVKFKSIVDNGDGTYTVTTCNTGYLFPCYKFTLDSVNYTVQEEGFIFNEQFKIKGNVIPSATELVMGAIKYYHGTVIATKAELDKEELSSDKFPMAYLVEVLQDDFDNSEDARIDRNSRLRLFFLSETDEENWSTDDHYEYSIKPMRNVVYAFINHLNGSNKVGQFNDWTAINHAKFGVYVADKGHTKRIFNDKLSGVEVQFTIPIVKIKDCKSNPCNN